MRCRKRSMDMRAQTSYLIYGFVNRILSPAVVSLEPLSPPSLSLARIFILPPTIKWLLSLSDDAHGVSFDDIALKSCCCHVIVSDDVHGGCNVLSSEAFGVFVLKNTSPQPANAANSGCILFDTLSKSFVLLLPTNWFELLDIIVDSDRCMNGFDAAACINRRCSIAS